MLSKNKYKVGDKFLVTGYDSNNLRDGLEGKVGTITRINADKTMRVAFSNGDSSNTWSDAGDMTPVPKNYKPKPVSHILQYMLDSDPFETFTSLADVKERINILVHNEKSLKMDSLVIYEVSKVIPITVKKTVAITGI